MDRKAFLKQSAAYAAGSLFFAPLLGSPGSTNQQLTILYTNDTHARLDPFPENAREFAGLGGIARRANLIKEIRKRQEHVLLLDAGDVFQGTPWFDLYGGEVDLELMSTIGYDAMAVGNHEFDRGLLGLADAAQKASFPLLAANYSVHKTPLNGVVQRFVTRRIAGVKVGIFGLGIELQGIVDPKRYGSVQSRDPIVWANGMVTSLRRYHNCDVIICLSHLGYTYEGSRMDDRAIAKQVEGVDLIIGGHTHTFLDSPAEILNPGGTRTLVTQMGHSGIRLGRIDIDLELYLEKRKNGIRSTYYTIGAT
ncbi:MAG: bifunctional metallophosphatase/5'-nucleotidase [Bacteroidetes bacterium]|jgi:5'-nucleotidase|nr:bifunctional metallophosphatase/5'-nucleotidase [Bacteroidota bacterium]